MEVMGIFKQATYLRSSFLIMLALFLALMSSPAIAWDDIKIQVKGQPLQEEPGGKLIYARIYVPIELVGKVLDIPISWDKKTNTVVVGKKISPLPPNPHPDKIRLFIDGKEMGPKDAPIVEQGIALVPFKVIADAFDAKIEWDEATLTLNILPLPKDTDLALVRIVSSPPPPAQPYPYYVLIPDDWHMVNAASNRAPYAKRFHTRDGLELVIDSSIWATPLVKPPTSYMYLGRDYLLGKKTPYDNHVRLLIGGKWGRYFKYTDLNGNIGEKFEIIDRYGQLTLIFEGNPAVMEKYQDTIDLITKTLQIPEGDPGAWGRILLARDYVNFKQAYDAEIKKRPDNEQLDRGEIHINAYIAQWESMQQWFQNQQPSEVLSKFFETTKTYIDAYVAYLKLSIDPLATASDLDDSIWHLKDMSQLYYEEGANILAEITAGFDYFDRISYGNFREYSMEYRHTDSEGNKLVYSVIIPKNWQVQLRGDKMRITDPDDIYSFSFWVDTAHLDLFELDKNANNYSPVAYTEMLLKNLKGKEILTTFTGVFNGALGTQILYRDYINNTPVLKSLTYRLGGLGSGYEVILVTFPEDSDLELGELLWIINDSWRVDFIEAT